MTYPHFTGMEKEWRLASHTLRQAARVCETIRAGNMAPRAKADTSPVTIADYASQTLICRAIREAFPDDGILAEETPTALADDAATLQAVAEHVGHALGHTPDPAGVLEWISWGRTMGTSGRRWILDPIDGTRGFIRGGQYAIALAVAVDEQIEACALCCPALLTEQNQTQALFMAQRGKGAVVFTDGSSPAGDRVQMRSSRDHVRGAVSFEPSHSNHSVQNRIAAAIGITEPLIRMDSQAKYGLLSLGRAEFYLRVPPERTPPFVEASWDHAAGSLLVTEAGGCSVDLDGLALDFSTGEHLTNNRGIVACTPWLRDSLLQAISQQF